MTALGPDFELHIVCDDGSTRSNAHGGRTRRIATYLHGVRTPAGTPEWWTGPPSLIERRRWADMDIDPGIRQFVRDDGAAVGYHPQHRHMPGAGHWKLSLRCPMCGLDLQRREDAALPVLERLRLAGVSRVSLAMLLATVR